MCQVYRDARASSGGRVASYRPLCDFVLEWCIGMDNLAHSNTRGTPPSARITPTRDPTRREAVGGGWNDSPRCLLLSKRHPESAAFAAPDISLPSRVSGWAASPARPINPDRLRGKAPWDVHPGCRAHRSGPLRMSKRMYGHGRSAAQQESVSTSARPPGTNEGEPDGGL
jgi:hypothetical protein